MTVAVADVAVFFVVLLGLIAPGVWLAVQFTREDGWLATLGGYARASACVCFRTFSFLHDSGIPRMYYYGGSRACAHSFAACARRVCLPALRGFLLQICAGTTTHQPASLGLVAEAGGRELTNEKMPDIVVQQLRAGAHDRLVSKFAGCAFVVFVWWTFVQPPLVALLVWLLGDGGPYVRLLDMSADNVILRTGTALMPTTAMLLLTMLGVSLSGRVAYWFADLFVVPLVLWWDRRPSLGHPGCLIS